MPSHNIRRGKNRLLMEARVLRHVQSTQPSAFIDNVGSASGSDTPPTTSPSDHPAPPRTYASVVRSITVAEGGEPAATVLLPKPRAIPGKRRRAPRTSKIARAINRRPLKRRGPKAAHAKTTAEQLGCLSSLAGLLRGFNPQLAAALAVLSEHLAPLLSLAQMLRKGRKSTHKNNNGQ